MSAASGSPVDDLIRDLGAVRVAADAVHADATAQRVAEDAIAQAVRAVGATIRDPDSPEAVSAARQAVQRSAQLIAALQTEAARSRRLASTAAGLRLRGRARRA